MDRSVSWLLLCAMAAIAALLSATIEPSRAAFTDVTDNVGNQWVGADCFATPSSVQRGTHVNNANGTSSVAITTVDPASSFLVFTMRTSGNRPVQSVLRGRLNGSGTAVEFVRVTDETSPLAITVEWYVVEYARGVVVQRGETAIDAVTVDQAIAAVDLSRAFVTHSKTANAADSNWDANDAITQRLTSSTNLQFEQGMSSTGHVAAWQVIEFDDPACVNVQRDTASIASGTTTVDVTLSSAVDLGRTFVLASYRSSGDGPDIGKRMVSARLLNATTVRLERSRDDPPGEDVELIAFEVVELGDGSSVQSGTATFTASDGTEVAALSTIDTSRAYAFTSAQNSGGQSGGRARMETDDVVGEAMVTLQLTPTQLTLTRDATSDEAVIEWFVVHW